MIFLQQDFLWLLILPALLLVLLFTGKKRQLAHIFSAEIYTKLTQNRQSLSHTVRLFLFIVAMILMITALAQPAIEKEKIKLNQKAIDVIAAVDISRSMEAKDLFPNRLQWAKKKLLQFIAQTQTIRVGVMAFAQNAYVVTPITEDKDVASYLVDNLDTSNITENGTNLLQLLDASNKQLKDALHKYIFLITDGGDNENFDKEIAFAKEHDLTLFILGVGTAKGAPIEDKEGNYLKKDGKIILTQLNSKIKKLALETQGVYIQTIASEDDITTMLQEIKKIAEAKTVATKEIRTFKEYFYYFLAAAALLLFLAFHSLPKTSKATLALVTFLFALPHDVKAGITDFQTIDQAQEAYENKDYPKAQSALESLSKESPSSESSYNLANTLYKQKKYQEAIKQYEALPKDFTHRQKTLHNLGNAYAQSRNLDKAIERYEEALKLGEDKQTRENLETVKKLKEQQQKKKQKKNPKQNNKKNKEGQDKKDQSKKKDKKSDKKEKKDQKSSQDQKQSEEKKEQKKSQNKQKEDKNKQNRSKNDKNKEKAQQIEQQPIKRSQKDLTDKEEKKLLQQLQMKKGNTFRYKIPSKFQQEQQHDKPW